MNKKYSIEEVIDFVTLPDGCESELSEIDELEYQCRRNKATVRYIDSHGSSKYAIKKNVLDAIYQIPTSSRRESIHAGFFIDKISLKNQ